MFYLHASWYILSTYLATRPVPNIRRPSTIRANLTEHLASAPTQQPSRNAAHTSRPQKRPRPSASSLPVNSRVPAQMDA